jgi:hypothetical protein
MNLRGLIMFLFPPFQVERVTTPTHACS